MDVTCSIAQFYQGRSVFITGATGFMGKALVEKLLRSCPGIDHIYLLIRSSAGKDANCRLNELIGNEVFDTIRQNQPEALDKLVAVAGDVMLPEFGLSASDLQILIKNVSIVFNSAATVKFDEELKTAVEMNVHGPKRLLELCRQMKQLKSVVHVSTAFNNLDRKEIDEVIYPTEINPSRLIDFLSDLKPEMVKSITPQLVGQAPNTYTYTKALAEQLLERECGDIPLAIVRPSIVSAALQEPMPGWIDNLNGMTGVMAGLGKGFLRVLKVKEELVCDIIPVDYPINMMIAVARYTALYKSSEDKNIAVFSCSSGHQNPITWQKLKHLALNLWKRYPTSELMWYPSGRYCSNDWSLNFFGTLYHTIPAYLLDFLSAVVGKRRKWRRWYTRADRVFKSYEYFTTQDWRFVSKNYLSLLDTLTEEDRSIFYFDIRKLDWQNYVEVNVQGTRKYILKDDPSTLPAARKNLQRMYLLKLFLQVLLLGLLAYFVSSIWESFSEWKLPYMRLYNDIPANFSANLLVDEIGADQIVRAGNPFSDS